MAIKIGKDHCTVEPVLKDHPIGHKKCALSRQVVSGDSSVILKCKSFCQICVVFQDRWSHGSGLTRQVTLY